MRSRSLLAIGLAAALCAAAGTVASANALSPTTSTTSTSAAPTSTAAPTTTVAPTTTTAPPDLLAGVNWIQATYASPCSDAAVQLVGGSAMQDSNRAMLDDVVALDSTSGLALVFLSCRGPGATTVDQTASVVRAGSGGLETLAELSLGSIAHVVAIDPSEFIVEAAAAPPPPGSCCAEVVDRRTIRAGAEGFTVSDVEQLAAFEQTVALAPTIGGDAEVVRRSVTPAALCFRWENVWLSAGEEPEAPPPLTEPSAELQTLRLALIHVTGLWIDPTDRMNAQMAAVVTAYQESRGLAVDGSIGRQTTRALETDLGCPERSEFSMVRPAGLGPRRYQSVDELLAATRLFATSGTSGNGSLDQLLTDSRWDGLNSMFLGCYRWESPTAGLACSWSGATPMQLVGLVDDPATPGLINFSILYARSTGV